MYDRVYNFNAGPAVLPEAVLEEAHREWFNQGKSGMAVMEMSHRSNEYSKIHSETVENIRKIMGVPDSHAVLFLQGGASLQFAMMPMNLSAGKSIDMLQTGAWTQKATEEAEKICKVRIAATTEKENFLRLPSASEMSFDAAAAYVHLCSNNTIFGTQYKSFPDTGKVPVVADMSSDILSRPVDVKKFGAIFAGAQKNLGPSGVTLVIIDKELAERADKKLPVMLQYRTFIETDSLYNTPPTFGIYLMGLVVKWIQTKGGLDAMKEHNRKKAAHIYDAIDATDYYTCPVKKEDRSEMNIVFRISAAMKDKEKEKLENQFVKEAEAAGLVGLKGHRSVGGLRASVYNAHPEEGCRALADFMKTFAAKNG